MPAVSKSQQRLFGWVHAYQKGEAKNAPKKIREIAKGISKSDAKDFAKTKRSGLPEKKAGCDWLNEMFLRGFLSRICHMSNDTSCFIGCSTRGP